jgi:dTDP-4-dehydrorhamnose reductase
LGLARRVERWLMKLDHRTRVYVAGCGGMLGEAVYHLFRSVSEIKATDIDVNTTWLSYADVRDLDGITRSVQEFQPNVILNLAALTDLSPTGC